MVKQHEPSQWGDETVLISTKLAVDAYDAFRFKQRFDVALRDSISRFTNDHALDVQRLPAGPILASKSTISEWRNSKERFVKRSKLVVWAVLDTTTINVSVQSEFLRPSTNFTQIAELGEVNARKISNAPNEDGEETYSVVMRHLSFKKGRLRVTSKWLNTGGGEREIGTVSFGLTEAKIAFSGAKARFQNVLLGLGSEERHDGAAAKGCGLVRGPGKQSPEWTVQARGEEWEQPILGAFENVRLCEAVTKNVNGMELRVTANLGGVDTSFFKFRNSDSQLRKDHSESELQSMRDTLFSAYLRRSVDPETRATICLGFLETQRDEDDPTA